MKKETNIKKIKKWLRKRYIYQWIAWRIISTWRIITQHAKHEQDWILNTFQKMQISFKCWIAIILGRELKDEHYPDHIPEWYKYLPDGIVVAVYDFCKTSGSLDIPSGEKWKELRYVIEEGIKLRYCITNNGY